VIRAIYEIRSGRRIYAGQNAAGARRYFAPAKHFITEAPARERCHQADPGRIERTAKILDKEEEIFGGRTLGSPHKVRPRDDTRSRLLPWHRELLAALVRRLQARRRYVLNYFPHHKDGTPDFLTVIDESHMTVPQLQACLNGDAARKKTLVEYGFRLTSAKDNRPLRFEEFVNRVGQTIYVSATPGPYERKRATLRKTMARPIVEQIIRPQLIDPKITIRPARGR